jgi:hypothetical protein
MVVPRSCVWGEECRAVYWFEGWNSLGAAQQEERLRWWRAIV